MIELEEKLKEEITELLRELQSQDSIELGNAQGRVKVYVNFGNKEAAEKKIGDAISVLNDKKAEALK